MIKMEVVKTAHSNAFFRLKECLDLINSGNHISGGVYEEVSYSYHVIAIFYLLSASDREKFRTNLMKSGCCYLAMLDNVRNENSIDSKHVLVSESLPFFDALAAGDLKTAREIVNKTNYQYFSDHEYEEDFLFNSVLHNIFAEKPENNKRNIFEKMKDVGVHSAKIDLCRVLIEKSSADFPEAFKLFIELRDEKLGAWRKSMSYRDEIDAIDGQVYIIGLAILRIAEFLGIQVSSQFRYIPSNARLSVFEEEVNLESWKKYT